jgi:hypothetical protein
MIRSMPVMFRVLGFSDWPLRVFIALVRHVILPLMGLLNIRKLAQDEARGMISELFEGMIPASAWRAGRSTTTCGWERLLWLSRRAAYQP